MFIMTEDELIEHNEEMEMRRELTSNQALLKSDKYVDCIRKLHIQLHGMSNIDLEKTKKVQRSGRSVKNEIDNSDVLYVNAAQPEELTKTEQTKQAQVAKDQEHQVEKIVVKPNVESPKHFHGEDEYEAAMADIKDEIRDYEEKYGDTAMQQMKLDAIIKELTRVDTTEEKIAEYENKKHRESKEWEKQFEGGQPVKREQTTNNPLEVFHRIRNGRSEKEDS